jgi:hypothetical protein
VRARAFGDAFQVTMVLRGYGVSVRRLQGDLPTDWLHDPYDRETFINVNPLFDFRTGSQGSRSVNLEGSAVHLTRSTDDLRRGLLEYEPVRGFLISAGQRAASTWRGAIASCIGRPTTEAVA